MNDLIRGLVPSPGRVAVATVALALCVAGLPPVLVAQRSDTIDVRVTLELGSLHAEIAYPRLPVQRREANGAWLPVSIPAFALWPWAGVDFSEAMSNLEAWNDAGQPVLIRATGPNEWEVPVGGDGFTMAYRIDSSKRSFLGLADTDLFKPTLTEDLALLWGRSWFMRPLDGVVAALPVRVTVSGAYPEAAFLGTADGRFQDTDALVSSVLVGGDVRTVEAGSGDGAIRFTLQGDRWRFSDDDFVGAIALIARTQSEAMGFDPGSSMDVLLLEGSAERSGGTAEGSVIAVYPDPELPLLARDPETLRLAAHEHFHRWNGEHAMSEPGADEGRYKWFQEGLTEYMAFRTLVAARFLAPADFVFKVNQYIDNYHRNAMAFEATADVMARDYWSDPRLQRLAYEKGLLLGLMLDARIRRFTAGESTIVDYLKGVITPDRPAAYDDDKLLEELWRLTGQSWAAFYEAFMLGSDPLPVAELCDDAGFDCRRERGNVWRLQPTDRTARALARLMR